MIMKGFSILLAMLLLLAACKENNDGGYEANSSDITVVRQDLTFDPQGRTGTLEFRANSAVSVSLTSDWCTAVVSGNVVSVTVTDNTSIEGRVAILTLNSGTSSLKMPVQQRGMMVTSFPVNDYHALNNGGVKSYTIRHDFPVELVTAADWIHPVMEGDKLNVTVDPNTTGQIRRGTIAMNCGGLTDMLNIVQYDLTTNVVGSYYLKGTSNDAPYELGFELYEKKGVFYIDWTSREKWTEAVFPVEFDAEKCMLTIPSAMEFYTASNGNYDIGYFFDTANALAQNASVGMSVKLSCEPSLQTTYGVLEDNGSWPGHTFGGFAIKSATMSGRLVKTTSITDLSVQRVGPLGSL